MNNTKLAMEALNPTTTTSTKDINPMTKDAKVDNFDCHLNANTCPNIDTCPKAPSFKDCDNCDCVVCAFEEGDMMNHWNDKKFQKFQNHILKRLRKIQALKDGFYGSELLYLIKKARATELIWENIQDLTSKKFDWDFNNTSKKYEDVMALFHKAKLPNFYVKEVKWLAQGEYSILVYIEDYLAETLETIAKKLAIVNQNFKGVK